MDKPDTTQAFTTPAMQAEANVLARFPDWQPSEAMLGYARAFAKEAERIAWDAAIPHQATLGMVKTAADACFEATGVLVTNNGMKSAADAMLAVMRGETAMLDQIEGKLK
jgi:hypothetical protein